jgi:hypothetical protein
MKRIVQNTIAAIMDHLFSVLAQVDKFLTLPDVGMEISPNVNWTNSSLEIKAE